jgi:hypothetical protein
VADLAAARVSTMAVTLVTTPVRMCHPRYLSQSCPLRPAKVMPATPARFHDRACQTGAARSEAARSEAARVFSQGIPNPDLVHAYMKECGIGDDKIKCVPHAQHSRTIALTAPVRHEHTRIRMVVVNVMAGENRSPEYVAKNPQGTVPALALEDGRVMGESTMI